MSFAHSIRQGVYQSLDKGNKQPIWVKNTSSIWLKNGAWTIGNKATSETEENSDIETYDGYGEIYCPYNVPNNKWLYFEEHWRDPENVKDIRIQCLEGKY